MTFTSVPVVKAQQLVADGAQLVDVREVDEFVAGSLPGAFNIPLSEFAARFRELDADRPVALLCRSGGRSAQAAAFLVDQGFANVTNLDGGILAAG